MNSPDRKNPLKHNYDIKNNNKKNYKRDYIQDLGWTLQSRAFSIEERNPSE